MNTKKRGEGREMGWENQPKQNMGKPNVGT